MLYYVFGILHNDTVLIHRMSWLHSAWPKVITSEPSVSGPEVRCHYWDVALEGATCTLYGPTLTV